MHDLLQLEKDKKWLKRLKENKKYSKRFEGPFTEKDRASIYYEINFQFPEAALHHSFFRVCFFRKGDRITGISLDPSWDHKDGYYYRNRDWNFENLAGFNQLRYLKIRILENRDLFQSMETGAHSLPESIGELKELRYLEIGNKLAPLPESIGELKELRYLDVSSNLMSSLPENIGELKKLRYLNVGSNELTSLPESIGELKKLEHLNVSSNELTSLPESIGELKKLEYLDIRSNPITLPASAVELKKLSVFNFDGKHGLFRKTEADYYDKRTRKIILTMHERCKDNNQNIP